MKISHRIREQVADYAFLENTRILARGIEGLYTQYIHQDGVEMAGEGWGLTQVKEFIQDTYCTSISPNTSRYLPQNPHVDFFAFRYPDVDVDRMKAADYYQMAAMLQMYWKLSWLETRQSGSVNTGDLFSEYELICNCMRELLDANMCYLAYRRLDDTQILAASSLRESELEAIRKTELKTMFGTQEVAALLDLLPTLPKIGLATGQWLPDRMRLLSLDNTIPGLDASSGKKVSLLWGDYLIIPMGLHMNDAGEEEIYLIFRAEQLKFTSTIPTLLSRIRDALFLRGRLMEVLSRDLFQLLSARNEYRSIRRKSQEDGPLRILHLSDLHVSAENYGDILGCVQRMPKQETFDFMVITGDVAQGRCSAGDLEANYRYAADVIRTLAFKIWATRRGEETILEQDWTKRLIIIPGNHDYASMNELETQHDETHRASISGRPAATEGSAMAKFTYYINFLRQLLDIDVGALIDNGMNELRSYDEMKVSFLALNSSIMANPIRNNKVRLDPNFCKRITAKITSGAYEQNQIVCLSHHGPDYHIDYVSDQYYEGLVCEQITKTFKDYFCSQILKTSAQPTDKAKMDECWQKVHYANRDVLAGLSPQSRRSCKKLLKNDSVQAWLRDNGVDRIPSNIVERVRKKRESSRLFADYHILSEEESFDGQHDSSEQYQKIRSSIQRAAAMSKSDQRLFEQGFQDLQNTGKISVTLSGHTHKRASSPKKNNYTADRFFYKKIRLVKGTSLTLESVFCLNYGICELPADRSKPNYEFQSVIFKSRNGTINAERTITHGGKSS